MKWGILQYVPLNVIGTLLTVILQYFGGYCQSSWNPKFGHIWIMGVNFISVSMATYFLIMFYFTIREDLKEYSPFYKFLAVKLVVFFSFWQSVLIEGLVFFQFIKATTYWSTTDISVGINALLIDFEMVFFAFMHVKAFSHKPYVPTIRNPALPPLDEDNNVTKYESQAQDQDNDNDDINPSMESIDSPSSPKSKRSQQKDKDKEKDKELPEMILDFSQKTPLWKGLLDSFNPLDTLRELGYGIQYLYRWLRGIPVDKDSRRLMDLELAFGRQRPEVPYIPPKDSEMEKKKQKKKMKRGEDCEDDSTGSNDDEDRDGNGHGGGGGGRKEDYGSQDGDAPGSDLNRPNRNRADRDRDLERGYASGGGESAAGGTRQSRNDRQPKRRADAAYDMAYGYGYGPGFTTSPKSTVRTGHGGVGVGGSKGAVVRKPVQSIIDNTRGTTSVDRQTAKGTRLKKESFEYLEKEDAARTDRATLPNILPEPVERKIALSGLYIDLPIAASIEPDLQTASPASLSSMDIPVPMSYHQQHRLPFESHDHRARDDWNQDQERDRDYRLDMEMEMKPVRFEHRDHELERAAMVAPEDLYDLPAPAIPRSTRPEMTGTPVRVMETPESITTSKDSRDKDGRALTQLINQNFIVKDPLSQPPQPQTQSAEIRSIIAAAVATQAAGNSAFAPVAEAAVDCQKEASRLPDEDKDGTLGHATRAGANPVQQIGEQGQQLLHERDDSGETTSAQSSSLAGQQQQQQFYHHREGSRSDPELSHYGHEYEHYVRQMILEEQEHQRRYYQQQLQGRRHQAPLLPAPESATPPAESTTAPQPVPLTHQRVQQLQQQLQKEQEQQKSQQAPPPPVQPPSAQYADPRDELDPIVAQYSQIQQRQKELEQQQQQQEQPPDQQKQQESERPQPQPRPEDQDVKSSMPKQPKPLLLPRRRNSLESLDSDSSGSFRFWGYGGVSGSGSGRGGNGGGSGPDGRDYYSYGGVYGPPPYARPRVSRYHRAYRYPMPLPQPVPPAQFYRFPEDRDLYEQRRRDQLRQQQPFYGESSFRPSAAAPFVAQQRDPTFYQGLPLLLQQQQQQYPQRAYHDEYGSRYNNNSQRHSHHPEPLLLPYEYDEDGYSRSHHHQLTTDSRYRSPPPPMIRSDYEHRMMAPPQQPLYGGAQPRGSNTRAFSRDPRDRDHVNVRDRDRVRGGADGGGRDSMGGTELLFPASRYAAPFLRDYELQQREGRRRMTQSPEGDRGRSGSDYRSQQPKTPRQRPPPTSSVPAMSAYDEDDGPYEEAVVWARPLVPTAAPTSSTGGTDGS
ncbi:hypothetical protein BGX28_008640 [Mortierella sp. GBA30]|nr:hypothetical protein BGX28_008640 [Mortierella sp. GBA30]